MFRAGKPQRKAHKIKEDVYKVLETGLPPGINVDDARDPGTGTGKRAGSKPA